jgi:hypothetical protein
MMGGRDLREVNERRDSVDLEKLEKLISIQVVSVNMVLNYEIGKNFANTIQEYKLKT